MTNCADRGHHTYLVRSVGAESRSSQRADIQIWFVPELKSEQPVSQDLFGCLGHENRIGLVGGVAEIQTLSRKLNEYVLTEMKSSYKVEVGVDQVSNVLHHGKQICREDYIGRRGLGG
jgi:hypothetical protein